MASRLGVLLQGNICIFNNKQLKFVASKYRVLSLEKCSGSQGGVKTEEALYTMAEKIKAIDPTIKVFF